MSLSNFCFITCLFLFLFFRFEALTSKVSIEDDLRKILPSTVYLNGDNTVFESGPMEYGKAAVSSQRPEGSEGIEKIRR